MIVLAITLSASRTGILISIIISVTYIIKRYKINFSNVTLWLKFIMMLLVIAIILGSIYLRKIPQRPCNYMEMYMGNDKRKTLVWAWI